MHRINLILNEILPENSVLDIGCADHFAEMAEEEYWLHKHLYTKTESVLGMDLEEKEVKKLKDRGYNVLQGNAENFNLEEKFDIINAGELIEHLSNPGTFLDNCYNHLKNDGKLIITAPNVWYLPYQMSVLIRGRPPLNKQHTCWYDKNTLIQLLERHNFKVQKLCYVKALPGQRGSTVSHLCMGLKMKQLGGESIFLVCKKKKDH